MAQATCFLDQVRKAFEVDDIDSRLLLLSRLDTNIQAFLSMVMPQCQEEPGIYCSSMNTTIRLVSYASSQGVHIPLFRQSLYHKACPLD
jgi:hypothetical protein